MKILFIQPRDIYKSRVKKFNSWLADKFVFGFGDSLAFPVLTALTPQKQDIELAEGGHDEIDYNKNYDLVGITSVTRYSILGYEIADKFRQKGIPVVLGGWHVSALPEEAKKHADSVVIGEAEETWPMLIKDLENGELKPFYTPNQPVKPENFPHPKINILPKRARSSVQATRGCPFLCEFCAINSFKFRNKFRMRPINEVIEDINSIPNRGFFFLDSSLTINTDYTKELFRQMKKLNKRFYAYGNIDVLNRDDELLKLSNEAGCYSWFVGLDSINKKSLVDIKKKTNQVEEYKSSIKKIHDYGISMMGSFIFGFDYDTIDIFDETDEFIRKSEIDVPIFQILTPYPGTALFNRFNKEGRILTKDWSKYDLERVVFQPKNMTKQELEENYEHFVTKEYNISRIIPRMIKNIKFGPNIFLGTTAMNFFFLTEKNSNKKKEIKIY